MSEAYSWHAMLEDFRRLGGIADNIEQRVGKHGNGIFPIDPGKPVHLEIPEKLLIDTEQIILDGEDLVVKPDAPVALEVRAFFTAYQRHYSWGAEGRRTADAFESGLKTLPAALLQRLKELQLVDLSLRHQGDWKEVVMQRFLRSRRINFHKRLVSMPIIELINHSPRSPGYTIRQSIKVAGSFEDEVTVNYNPFSDSILRFLNYGFASEERIAYSLPMHMKSAGKMAVRIIYDATVHEKSGSLMLPKVEKDGQGMKLSHLKLGIESTPRMPRTLFRKVMQDMPTDAADEFFDRIRSFNLVELCNLLEMLDGETSPLAMEFRRALRMQLRAMANCFGVRKDL